MSGAVGLNPNSEAELWESGTKLPLQADLSHFQHPVERDSGPVLDALTHLDAIDDAALDKILKRPS